MKTAKIPETDSIEELAKFWDTHDLTDFEDQLEVVTTPVFQRRRPKEVVSVRLQPNEVAVVEKIAKVKGLEASALIHDWVIERLNQELSV